ncbi:MAG: 23S rRNA pseudouridine1911/1915/1917 synthase [Rugosibacter sp.]|nr:23S rRNA pseudouridine1911/1915/1917 synthase [Rugosibacter sp.]
MNDASEEISLDYSPSQTAALPPESLAIPPDYAGMRLDVALAKMYPEHSRSRLQEWLKAGLVSVDGVPTADKNAGKRHVLGGEEVSFGKAIGDLLQTQGNAAEDIALNIVFEDDALIVINKPAGLVVHPGNGNATGTLLNALLHHAPQLAAVPRAGIVHRLDKDTSGLLVVAKTLTAQTDLVRQLQARSVHRHYLALALGVIEHGGTIDIPIARHPTHRTKMAVVRPVKHHDDEEGENAGKEARTHYSVRERFAKCTLLECRLETGRTHQIRVHLAHKGHPLAGDAVYGKTCSGEALLDAFPRQALHAWRLALIHPVSGEEVSWEVPLPDDFEQLLQALRQT